MRGALMRGLALVPLLACAALLIPSALVSQIVSARVLDDGNSGAVVGALVHLLDDAGSTVQRGLTGEGGSVRFAGVPPGRYRLRAEMIGRETRETEPFEVLAGSAVRREVRLPTRPIALEGLDVEVGGRCRVRPAEGALTARLWEEARKALTLTTLTQQEDVYTYRTMLYERDLDRDGDVVRRETRSRREATLRRPFQSRPAEELARRGYVDGSGSSDLYFAPDAEVLLSDAFLDAHCFRPERGGEREETTGLVGLAFEPLELRSGTVDIAGTLWLDPASSELRWLEYRYENLHPDIRSDELGGRVEFERMPEGTWIVRLWWIRMPTIASWRNPASGEVRPRLAGLREAGGMVLEVLGARERVAGAPPTGRIQGVVRDSLGFPAEGVRVRIVGLDREVSTDSAGGYLLGGLVEGTYQVRFTDPDLEPWGVAPAPLTREVPRGGTATLDVRLSSVTNVLAETCRERRTLGAGRNELPAQARDGRGILAGWVRDARTDEPLPGAVVRASRSAWEVVVDPFFLDRRNDRAAVIEEPYAFEATADEGGFYVLCDLPEDWRLEVAASHEGAVSVADTLGIPPGGIVEHTIRIRREGGPATGNGSGAGACPRGALAAPRRSTCPRPGRRAVPHRGSPRQRAWWTTVIPAVSWTSSPPGRRIPAAAPTFCRAAWLRRSGCEVFSATGPRSAPGR